ncbi:MAG TPA: GNAT family N-acetyltransferase [Chroococcales cyanobacterium]
MSEFENDEIALRRLTEQDLGHLLRWLNAPHVAMWWDGQVDYEGVTKKYGPLLEPDAPVKIYVIELSGRPIGFVQCYRHSIDKEYAAEIGIPNAAGIDYLIGEADCIGKGIGTRALSAVAEVVFDLYPDIEIVVADPQTGNTASWRALEKAGYERLDERTIKSEGAAGSGPCYIYGYRRVRL